MLVEQANLLQCLGDRFGLRIFGFDEVTTGMGPALCLGDDGVTLVLVDLSGVAIIASIAITQ